MAEQQDQSTNQTVAQPAKNGKGKVIVLVVGSLFAVCFLLVVLGGVGGYFFYKGASAPVSPIKAQLEALNKGDVQGAYNDYTSKIFRDKTSYDEYVEFIDKYPQIFESKSSSFTNVEIKNGEALVTGTITGKDGTKTKMAYKLVKENDKWVIYGFETR